MEDQLIFLDALIYAGNYSAMFTLAITQSCLLLSALSGPDQGQHVDEPGLPSHSGACHTHAGGPVHAGPCYIIVHIALVSGLVRR